MLREFMSDTCVTYGTQIEAWMPMKKYDPLTQSDQ